MAQRLLHAVVERHLLPELSAFVVAYAEQTHLHLARRLAHTRHLVQTLAPSRLPDSGVSFVPLCALGAPREAVVTVVLDGGGPISTVLLSGRDGTDLWKYRLELGDDEERAELGALMTHLRLQLPTHVEDLHFVDGKGALPALPPTQPQFDCIDHQGRPLTAADCQRTLRWCWTRAALELRGLVVDRQRQVFVSARLRYVRVRPRRETSAYWGGF